MKILDMQQITPYTQPSHAERALVDYFFNFQLIVRPLSDNIKQSPEILRLFSSDDGQSASRYADKFKSLFRNVKHVTSIYWNTVSITPSYSCLVQINVVSILLQCNSNLVEYKSLNKSNFPPFLIFLLVDYVIVCFILVM